MKYTIRLQQYDCVLSKNNGTDWSGRLYEDNSYALISLKEARAICKLHKEKYPDHYDHGYKIITPPF